MPKNSESTDYLYDFIYADVRRIYSYLSQIDPSGVVTAIKEVTSESDTNGIDGELNVKVVRATLKGLSANSQSLEHQFDATPTLPWSLINHLDSLGYLNSDLHQTPIGGLVHLKGALTLADVRLMREAWRPLIEWWYIETEQILQNQIKAAKGEAIRELKTQLDLLNQKVKYERASTELLEKLPHTVNMTLTCDEDKCWSFLSPQNFLFDPEDILLKHGTNISGVWHMVAIVDAEPQFDVVDPGPWLAEGNFQDLMVRVTNIFKFRFGRPAGHYGVTPIAIYRTVQRPIA